MRVLLFPIVEGRVTHPELPAEVADRGVGVGLSDRVQDLFLGELLPLHGSAPFVRDRRSRHVTLVLTCRRFRGRRQTIDCPRIITIDKADPPIKLIHSIHNYFNDFTVRSLA